MGLARFSRLILFVFFLALAASCARKPVEDEMIVPPKGKAEPVFESGGLFTPGQDDEPVSLSLEEFSQKARQADYILLGEGHASACDHAVQARIIRELARAGLDPAIGLEMANELTQPGLDRFNQGTLDLEELEKELDWKETWGHPFELYEPVFAAAVELSLPLYGLNIPPSIVRKVSREGLESLGPEEKKLVPAVVVPPLEEQKEALGHELGRHKAMAGKREFDQERFFLVQSLWDSKMAERAVEIRSRTGRPVVVLAGAGHVENGWGVAHRLRVLDPKASDRILLVAPWRGTEELDPARADVFFYCPLTHTSRLGFSLKSEPGRVTILAVAPGTRADKAGFKAGDLLLKISGRPVDSLRVLHEEAVKAKFEGRPLEFVLERDGSEVAARIDFTPDPPDNSPQHKDDVR